MIAVDTSALMAIVLNEAQADACIAAPATEDDILISAGTVAEALIVSAHRNVGKQMSDVIEGLGFEIVTVTHASARRIAQAYERCGKGVHPAGLNVGDCFACELAKDHAYRLLYVGNDFPKTGIEGVHGKQQPELTCGAIPLITHRAVLGAMGTAIRDIGGLIVSAAARATNRSRTSTIAVGQ